MSADLSNLSPSRPSLAVTGFSFMVVCLFARETEQVELIFISFFTSKKPNTKGRERHKVPMALRPAFSRPCNALMRSSLSRHTAATARHSRIQIRIRIRIGQISGGCFSPCINPIYWRAKSCARDRSDRSRSKYQLYGCPFSRS